MNNVSLIDGHIDKVERCVMCGKVIPEGRQVCYGCEICIQENKAYWHGKLDNLLKEMEGRK